MDDAGIPGKTIERVAVVAVVATGVIGASWAAHFLAHGLDVVATDPAPGAEQRLHAEIDAIWPTLERLGLAGGASRGRGSLRFESELESAVQGVDFVQENGPERADVKTELFRRLDAVLAPDVILASSSSGLAATQIQSACAHPQRVLVGHPFNPPHLVPLVEVVGGRSTSEAAVRRAIAFYAATGKHPIRVRREVPGHIANRLQAALWREAFHLVAQGVASVEDVDTAIAQGPGLRWAVMGPFLNLHLSGGDGGIEHLLEHLGGPISQWWKELGDPELTPALKAAIAAGVADEMRGGSRRAAEARRDELLVDLIRNKKRLARPG
jgi:3-hydroxyacyl-CoA dehydrogenase